MVVLIPLLALIYIMSKAENTHFLKDFLIRNDDWGKGHFGADRGNHKHNGVDILVNQGDIVKAPFNGIIIRDGYVYSGDYNYKLLVIQGTEAYKGFTLKIFYVQPLVSDNTHVKQGDVIGYAQSISAKYGSKMLDHLHIEAYNPQGKLINPEIFF